MTNPVDMNSVEIGYLADHRQHAATVSTWLHDQWGQETSTVSFADRLERVRLSSVKGRIPTAFVALVGQRLVGVAFITAIDMTIRPKLTPWLSSVYVESRRRGGGTGSQLVIRAMQEARALDQPALYLFTPDKESFYARLGWQTIEECNYRGHDNVVMKHNLRTIPQDGSYTDIPGSIVSE